MKAMLASAVLVVVLTAASAAAQETTVQAGEVVVTSDGQLNTPWVEKSVCEDDVCRVIVYNPATHEIARVNGRLTNAFVLSGTGQEVVRKPD